MVKNNEKHVFIVGSRGYHFAHGGWETFVDNLVDHYDDTNTIFHISELSFEKKESIHPKKNIYVDYIKVPHFGHMTMLIQTIKAFKYYLNYIKKNKLKNCYIYVLGLKLAHYLVVKKRKLKKLGIKLYLNPDGLEWKRSKWNYFVKKFFLLSEKLMLNYCDMIICDSKGIVDYIEQTYPKNKVPKKYIAYGTIPVTIDQSLENSVMRQYNLKKDNFFLIVCRFVPENNFELIIREFMKTNINKELVIVGNINDKKFYNSLLKKTSFDKDKRIRFLGPIYDVKGLTIIRNNAFAYIHGHSVGGTNPSLLESMSTVNLNILYDVNFNSLIGQDSCLYFNSNDGSLSSLLSNVNYLKKIQKTYGIKAKAIVKNHFTWEIIINKYKEIFK